MRNDFIISLVNRSDMSQEEKEWVIQHLENYEMIVNSLQLDLMAARDAVDKAHAVDEKVLTIKEQLATLDLDSGLREQIDALWRYIETC